ncbi:MAG: hypothetical protein GX600_11165 [Dehalococcoidia bacterium]|nr:hypothetical protein [Dehalococcoidia bacterium]
MKMDVDARYVGVCIAAMLLLMPVAAWGSYYEGFNANNGGWNSVGPGAGSAAEYVPSVGRTGGAIECSALGEAANKPDWNIGGGTGDEVWRPFWRTNDLEINFAVDRSIEAYFSKVTSDCDPGTGNVIRFYLGGPNTATPDTTDKIYYYYSGTYEDPVTFNAPGSWTTPTALTLDNSSWTWMGSGTNLSPGSNPGTFDSNLLSSATEFGWALVGTGTGTPKGQAYMDDFSATPTPAAAVLFPIGAAAVLWARRKRQAQQDARSTSGSADVST